MAALVNHAISPIESDASSGGRSTASSRMKSFSSLVSNKPRDSLEKVRRQREKSMAHTSSFLHNRSSNSARNYSIQVMPENDQEEDDNDDELESVSPPVATYHPPIHRGAVCERYPKGKASFLVLLLNFLAMYAFSTAIAGILDIFHTEHNQLKPEFITFTEEKWFNIIHLLLQNSVSHIFFPFAGFIADVYIGRNRMIHIAFLLLFLGYGILTMSFALGSTGVFVGNVIKSQYIIRGIAFVIISAGGGAFEATIIPFGVDQLQGASSEEISSYFYFFYFTRNLAMACGIIVYGIASYLTNAYRVIPEETYRQDNAYNVLQPLVTTAILTVGIVLYICFNHWFFKNTLWENPVKLVAKILCYAATVKRHLPVHRRAFRYGEGKKSRIDLAKVQYDGKYSAEKVEDVKTFCRILLLMFTLIPNLFTESAFQIMTTYEVNRTLDLHYHNHALSTDLYPNIYYAVNSLCIILTLPIINFIVIPYAPKLTIRARIGIGLVLYLIGSLVTIAIHLVHLGKITKYQTLYMLLPVAVYALAEVLTVVSMLEFIYAQSPESMKGLLTGLYFFMFGLNSVASSAISYLYINTLESRRLVLFHAAFSIIQVIGIVFYGIVATIHKNRLRPDGDSFSQQQQLIIEDRLSHTGLIT